MQRGVELAYHGQRLISALRCYAVEGLTQLSMAGSPSSMPRPRVREVSARRFKALEFQMRGLIRLSVAVNSPHILDWAIEWQTEHVKDTLKQIDQNTWLEQARLKGFIPLTLAKPWPSLTLA